MKGENMRFEYFPDICSTDDRCWVGRIDVWDNLLKEWVYWAFVGINRYGNVSCAVHYASKRNGGSISKDGEILRKWLELGNFRGLPLRDIHRIHGVYKSWE